MKDRNYFGKEKTGGANASKGFYYQDLCIIYYLINNLNANDFKAIGVETDDDFTLMREEQKTFIQVKCQELTIPLVGQYIGDNKILIGPSKNSSLSTFLAYLNQYRNQQTSCEDVLTQVSVTEDFKLILKRSGFSSDNLNGIPNTWFVEIIPEDKVEELIRLKIVEWGIKNSLLLDGDCCLKDLRVIVADSRVRRSYLKKSDAIKIFEKYSKTFLIQNDIPDSLSSINFLNLDEKKILSSVDSKITQAEYLLKDERYDEALSTYITLSHVIESEYVYVRCAALFQLLGKFDEAIIYCDKALAVHPTFHCALSVKGTLHADKGDFDFSLELLLSAEYHKGDVPFTLYNIGVVFLKLKKIDEAIQYFEKTIAVDSQLSSPHLNLGVCLYNKGSFSASLKHLDMALLLEPGLPQALSQKGQIKRFYGEIDDAITLFERCLLATPNNDVAELGLALCLIEKGNPLGYGLLVRKFSEELCQLEINKSIAIMDIGWVRSNCISIKNLDGASYLVSHDDIQAYVPKSDNDIIGVGILRGEGDAAPLILKSYSDLNAFRNAVNAIRLDQKTDLFVPVTGDIKSKGDHCEVKINFDHYLIYGKTNRGDNGGFKAFCDHYKGCLFLLLEHKETNQTVVFTLLGLECYKH